MWAHTPRAKPQAEIHNSASMTLEEVVDYAKAKGEPAQTSGKQELYEAIVNMYV